mmetsp:Transcript_22050/g.66176  ORF Transcript_22050/g.66176 Transcript_22050/m.66176 type:complete len:266 (-) Transcript_22050:45-842(-)
MSRLSRSASDAPPMAAVEATPALPDMTGTSAPPSPAPEPAAADAPSSPARTPMKYPAMMQSGASQLASVPLDDAGADLGPHAPPAFLVPPTVRTASAVEEHARTFDAAFAPLASLTSDDVVVGCSAHGAEFIGDAKDHLGRFRSHVGAVDYSHGPKGIYDSLEGGELANLPLAATKGCVGLSLYSTATVARFTPALWRAAKLKFEEWRVLDKLKVAKTVALAKAGEAAVKAKEVGLKGWKWLKTKIDEKRNGAGLPEVTDKKPLQ